MAIFASVSQGWQIFKQTLAVLKKFPVLAAPLFLAWMIMASVVLLFRYYDLSIGLVFLAVFIVAYSLSAACILMLELMQQIESGKNTSLAKAIGQFIGNDSIKAIPIALIWSVIWFIILILRAMTRKDSDKGEPSVADAGRTLSGLNTPFSWIGLGLDMLEKLLRMAIFSMLPAIAWEDLGPWQAAKRGSKVIRQHPTQFLTNYGLTAAAGTLMAIPLIPIAVLDEQHVSLPPWLWIVVIIYSGIIWTIEMYLEQMSVALLYLWHLKWEKAGARGDLSSVAQPDLLDDVPEFNAGVQLSANRLSRVPVSSSDLHHNIHKT
jgi:hypothetical protein